MTSILVATVVFGSAMGGAILGLLLQWVLPERYLEHQTKEIVRLGTGLIATMAALVLGLLVSTAKSTFDDEAKSFRQLALNIVMLDRTLAQYGEGSLPARDQLKRTTAQTIASLWPNDPQEESSSIDDARITTEGIALVNSIRNLPAADESQQSLKSSALQLCTELTRDRWSLSQRTEGSLPLPFLVVLAFWLAVLFGSFGLFSPRNALAVAALVVCAASVAGAVFLIVDLDQPFDGLVKVSSTSLRDAFSKLGK